MRYLLEIDTEHLDRAFYGIVTLQEAYDNIKEFPHTYQYTITNPETGLIIEKGYCNDYYF